jgi:hypothetical protein
VTGDGLVRPLNAPVAGQLVPGVQPGTSGGVVVAREVIVFGTGTGTGIFAYSPTPGPNNLVYSETQAAADSFGNTTVPGTTVYQGNIALNMVASGFTVYSNSSSGQTGVWTQLGAFFLTTPVAVSYWYSTIGIVTAQPNYFQQPGTVPPPVVPEMWHAMIFTAGYTGTGRYKILSDGLTVMIESVGAIATNGTVANGTQIWTPPAGYVPAQAQQMVNLSVGAVGAGSAAAAVSPWLAVTPTGLLVEGIATQVATTVRFSGTYALD